MIDILRNRRFISANMLAGITLAATTGCIVNGDSPEERMNASYDQSFVSDLGTACYDGILDHESVAIDLKDELDKRVWLDADSLNDSTIEAAAKDITTILTVIPQMNDNESAAHTPQRDDKYEFCIQGDEIQAGDPTNFATIEYTR